MIALNLSTATVCTRWVSLDKQTWHHFLQELVLTNTAASQRWVMRRGQRSGRGTSDPRSRGMCVCVCVWWSRGRARTGRTHTVNLFAEALQTTPSSTSISLYSIDQGVLLLLLT